MTQDSQTVERLKQIYGSEEEYKYAISTIEQISEDLELREKETLLSNGIAYSDAYVYNIKKGINYSPPRNLTDDREVSFGIVHEKIITFMAIFLKYVYKRHIKCYKDGSLVRGMGRFYDLAIEYSYSMEQMVKKIALIYWEVFTQGNAFVLEDWEVKTFETILAYNDKKQVTPETMDYTYEFLDGLTYEVGKTKTQTRRAVSKVLDGRQVIFGNPEIEEIQEQPRITIEETLSKADAEKLFGTLKRWTSIPKTIEDITKMVGDTVTIFDAKRHKNPEDQFMVHYFLDKENNRMNIFVNGIMMLPMKTPMTIFHPRNNYPISNVAAERLRGSIYARGVPAKIKFNADFVDWSLKMMARKFEQGIDPAILAKGRYTLTRKMFQGGQVTHGVTKDMYEKADPDNKGVTGPEFSFVNLMKEIVETQTVNNSFSGELSGNATATEIATVDSNQQTKLALLLDGIKNGFMDMALRRAETIESKYTVKQKEILVDGNKVNMYQNFSINISGIENIVRFDDRVGQEGFDQEAERGKLFKKSYEDRKSGFLSEYHLINPKMIREERYNIVIEIIPERLKDNQLQMIQMWDEFDKLLAVFGREDQGGMVRLDQLKKEYLDVSGRPDELFTSQMYQQLEQKKPDGQLPGQTNKGSFGQPRVKEALLEQARQS